MRLSTARFIINGGEATAAFVQLMSKEAKNVSARRPQSRPLPHCVVSSIMSVMGCVGRHPVAIVRGAAAPTPVGISYACCKFDVEAFSTGGASRPHPLIRSSAFELTSCRPKEPHLTGLVLRIGWIFPDLDGRPADDRWERRCAICSCSAIDRRRRAATSMPARK